MPQLTEPGNLPPAPLHRTIKTSIGGDYFRLRLSNVFGGSELPITAVSIALPTNGSAGVSSIQPNTGANGHLQRRVVVQYSEWAQVVSDPIKLNGHPGSRTTSWMAFGNQVNALDLEGRDSAREGQSTNHWYWISSWRLGQQMMRSAFAIVGDSITDGRGSTDNGTTGWPDLLLARLQKSPLHSQYRHRQQSSWVGNRILADGLGPNTLGRIDRDVLPNRGVKYAMIFEGVNEHRYRGYHDGGPEGYEDRLIWALQADVVGAGQLLLSLGLVSVMAHPTREVTRQKTFDAVVDFDKLLRDPAQTRPIEDGIPHGRLSASNVAGFQLMADAIPLDFFSKFKILPVGGVRPPGL
ncbi:lipolytic enzyme [Coprinopsis sp. MPI-PUGE-AT-0042]|nr:lipolytic enzyme [Coprinopsis sp. MPI-PUGE-AT-0042]